MNVGTRVAPLPAHAPRSPKGHSMQEKSTDPHPLSDLAYDWITMIQNKAQALLAYDQYIKDAEAANSKECADFFRKVHDADKAQLAEAKQHLIAVLQGTMGTAPKR
jgi:ABC-type Zn uptake system ZnuABC Zn-binding protein ZnuA